MCYQPLHLLNPIKNFDPFRDRLFNSVPCGKCSECATQKQRDWCVRSYFEYLDCKRHGGFCGFVTLTYNEFHVPTCRVYTSDNNSHLVRCFSKHHIQKLLKLIRKRELTYYKSIGKDITKSQIKYIVTSEYGKKKTKRPHYHCLFYVHNNLISPLRLQAIISECWLNVYENGIVKFGGRNGLPFEISSNGAITYVTKYICKDVNFFTEFLGQYTEEEIQKIEELKAFKPFHIQSQGFGISALELANQEELKLGKIIMPVLDGYKYYNVPLYLDRKKYYEPITTKITSSDGLTTYSTTYKLLPEGFEAKEARRAESRDKLIVKLYNFVFCSHNVDNDFIKIFNQRTYNNFTDLSEVQSYCKDLLSENSIEDVIDYSINFKDYVKDTTAHELAEIRKERYLSCDEYENCSLHDKLNYMSNLENYSKTQHDFDIILELYSNYNYCQGIFRQRNYDRMIAQRQYHKPD